MTVTLKEIIYDVCGGMLSDDRKLKAIIPGGSSCPVLTAKDINTPMCFDELQKINSMLGSAGVIVMDESVCMVDTAINIARFYVHESCGQCTPCRVGGAWLLNILNSIEAGTAKMEDLDLLLDICWQIDGKTVCPFGEAMVWPIQSYAKRFRKEFEQHIIEKGCPIKKDRSIRR
jgi:NADH-quinone oxidoreductase subunit F